MPRMDTDPFELLRRDVSTLGHLLSEALIEQERQSRVQDIHIGIERRMVELGLEFYLNAY